MNGTYHKEEKTCRKICLKYLAKKERADISYYELEGIKYCQHCRTFMIWTKNYFCPCCGRRVRSRPRTTEAIDKYRLVKKVVYQ